MYFETYNYTTLKDSAASSKSFDEYADDSKFQWIFSIAPSDDSKENSVSSKIRHLLIDYYSPEADINGEDAAEIDYKAVFIKAIKDMLQDDDGENLYDKVFPIGKNNRNTIDEIFDSQQQKRSIENREQLIVICFAMVSLGCTVDDCDDIMRVASNETCHHRELYQLDAEEGFYRFILYWNTFHFGENITYCAAKRMLPGFLENLQDDIAEKIDLLEKEISNDSYTEAEQAGFVDAVENISAEAEELSNLADSTVTDNCTDTFREAAASAFFYAQEKSKLAITLPVNDYVRCFEALAHNDIDDAIALYDKESTSIRYLLKIIKHFYSLFKLGENAVALLPALSEYILTLKTNPAASKSRPVVDELIHTFENIKNKQETKSAASSEKTVDKSKSIESIYNTATDILQLLYKTLHNLIIITTINSICVDGKPINVPKDPKTISEDRKIELFNLVAQIEDEGFNAVFSTYLDDALQNLRDLTNELPHFGNIIDQQRAIYARYKDSYDEINRTISQRRTALENILNIKCFKETINDRSRHIRSLLTSPADTEKAGILALNASKIAVRRNITGVNSSALNHGTAACCHEVEEFVEEFASTDCDFITALEVYTQKAARFIGEKDWTAVSIIINAVNDSDRINKNKIYFEKRCYNTASTDVSGGKLPDRPESDDNSSKPRLSHVLLPGEIINRKNAAAIRKMMNPRRRDYREAFIISGSDRSSIVDSIIASCDLINDGNSKLINGAMSTSRRDLLRFALAAGCDNTVEVRNILSLSGTRDFDQFSAREMLVRMLLIYLEKPDIDYKSESYLASVLEGMRKLENKALIFCAETASLQGKKADVVESIITDSVKQLKKIILFPAPSIIPRKEDNLYIEFEFCFYAVQKAYERFINDVDPRLSELRELILCSWLDAFARRAVELKETYSSLRTTALTVEYSELSEDIRDFCGSLIDNGKLKKPFIDKIREIQANVDAIENISDGNM